MFGKTLFVLMAASLSCACAHGQPGAQDDSVQEQREEQISYALTPCFGFCPHFEISISEDGSGSYYGHNFVKEFGEHRFQASPAEYELFARRLAEFRPKGSATYDWENCDGPVATDHPSVSITWREQGGERQSLDWYMGCRQPGLSENMAEISEAWQAIPAVAKLVGTSEERKRAAPQ